MGVIIKPVVQGEQYTVNGVYVTKRGDNWHYSMEPSQKEVKAFGIYLEEIINNPSIKKHTTATYKG
jgi:hypothetical protein